MFHASQYRELLSKYALVNSANAEEISQLHNVSIRVVRLALLPLLTGVLDVLVLKACQRKSVVLAGIW